MISTLNATPDSITVFPKRTSAEQLQAAIHKAQQRKLAISYCSAAALVGVINGLNAAAHTGLV